jgi:hypothetical protein
MTLLLTSKSEICVPQLTGVLFLFYYCSRDNTACGALLAVFKTVVVA